MTTVTYGQAAHGGKIHRASSGIAFCLSGNGHKPLRNIVAEIQYGEGEYADAQAEAASLLAAHVSPGNVCSKCAGVIRKTMEVAA